MNCKKCNTKLIFNHANTKPYYFGCSYNCESDYGVNVHCEKCQMNNRLEVFKELDEKQFKTIKKMIAISKIRNSKLYKFRKFIKNWF